MVLVKEYRIPLPLTVEEYRVAQLFMIATCEKTSRKNKKIVIQHKRSPLDE